MLRGIIGSSGAVLYFWSLKYMDAADSTVILLCAPVFVAIVAYFVLGEKFGLVSILTCFLTVTGVVVISRPPFLTATTTFDYNLMIGSILAIGAMIVSTYVFILLRYLRKVNYAIITTTFSVAGGIEGLILCLWVSKSDLLPHCGWDWILGAAIGIFSFGSQITLTASLKYEAASLISLLRTTDVIFVGILQEICLNVVPDGFSLFGSALIITGVLLAGFRKWLDELPENNNLKELLWFVLK